MCLCEMLSAFYTSSNIPIMYQFEMLLKDRIPLSSNNSSPTPNQEIFLSIYVKESPKSLTLLKIHYHPHENWQFLEVL